MKTAQNLILVASVALLPACGILSPKNPADQQRAARFECEVEAVAPLAGSVLDAAELMRDIYAGKAELPTALAFTKATPPEVDKLVKALRACKSALVEEEPTPEPPHVQEPGSSSDS